MTHLQGKTWMIAPPTLLKKIQETAQTGTCTRCARTREPCVSEHARTLSFVGAAVQMTESGHWNRSICAPCRALRKPLCCEWGVRSELLRSITSWNILTFLKARDLEAELKAVRIVVKLKDRSPKRLRVDTTQVIAGPITETPSSEPTAQVQPATASPSGGSQVATPPEPTPSPAPVKVTEQAEAEPSWSTDGKYFHFRTLRKIAEEVGVPAELRIKLFEAMWDTK